MEGSVRSNRGGADFHCYSDRLKRKLNKLITAPVAVLEAPVGYGKTTAVQDCLDPDVVQATRVHWFSAVEENPEALYHRFCLKIGEIDRYVGERLLEIGLPGASTIGSARDALKAMSCNNEEWLVIENFQLLYAALPPLFLVGLLELECDALHIVIITQRLAKEFLSALTKQSILHITASDLRMDSNDIHQFFTLNGVNISETKAQQIQKLTDGWITAVHSQFCACEESGSLSESAVQNLIERLIWNKLTVEQQRFLLHLSPFETITVRQVCSLLQCEALPEYALECLSVPFIQFDAEHQHYTLHKTLQEFLLNKRAGQGRAFEQECLTLAGDLYKVDGRVSEALNYYVGSKDYERILSLDLSHFTFEEVGGRPFFEIAQELALSCPQEIKRKYPLSMLCIAWALKSSCQDNLFNELIDELDGYLPKTGLLRAEWTLLSSYRYYPYLEKMIPLLREAIQLFDGSSSRVILPETPWTFGSYVQVSELHVQAGQADREADVLEEFIALHSRLTNGRGTGADALFRAELAYMRGDITNAEIFAHKAYFLAESKQQIIIQLGATMALASIAVLKTDASAWQLALNSLEHVAANIDQTPFIGTILDTVRGTFLARLGVQTHLADWLKQGNFSQPFLIAPLYTNALYAHALFLLHQGDYTKLIGRLEAEAPGFRERSVYSAFVCSILLAAGYVSIGNNDKAIEALRYAAELALPDGFLIHFITFYKPLNALTEELIEKDYPQFYSAFISMKEQFDSGWGMLKSSVPANGLSASLTIRENEIALLASEGLHNKEIARRLFVSESTVRTHLRSVFNKLDVDRRAALAAKLRQVEPA